ncbi:hypothetical protein [Bartonella machadoae]|uniref:hypothetical protein n=1 Tax=Bartonella machadoae TaxID=2893471 RepID=UPI001F4C780B|nr:hypothetical protein [Bartonella machadoae]UNE55447.1 hypothetical protein LNM86_06515 [Bartonella machadoae]
MNKKYREGLSVRAFAKKMGVSHNAVVSRIKTGKFDAALFEDGSVNEALATAIWNENPTKKTHQKSTQIKQDSAKAANEFEIKLERIQVALEREKIALEKLRETTVDREEMKKAAREFGRAHRDAMLKFPHRFGASIAAQVGCDAASLIGAIDYYMRTALLEAVNIPVPFHDPHSPELEILQETNNG